MNLQAVVRWILPRADYFYDYLEQQAVVAHEGAKTLAEFANGRIGVDETRTKVQEWEHKGDSIVHELEEALARTFVTPIDREDLHKMSSELDGVLDLTNAAIRACSLLGVEEPNEPMKRMIDAIVLCTEKIRHAMPNLRKHDYQKMVAVAREIRRIEKEADTIYRDALFVMFRGPSPEAKVLIREQTVLSDLENALDQCDALAETLTYLAVKHG